MKQKIEPQQSELIICICNHKWYKHHKEVGMNVYECEKCGNDNMKKEEKLNNAYDSGSRLPIGIRIQNISNKMYENVSIFDYKKKTNLIYGSHYAPALEYDDILRFLTGIRYEDDKKIDCVVISAKSEDKENQKKQLVNNLIIYKKIGIDGREISIPYEVQKTDIELPSSVTYFMNKNVLHNRCNLLLSKFYPYTTVDILIFPTQETKYF
jgi:hypothetical protein